MTDSAAIVLDDVSLRYQLATQRVGSVKEYFIHLVRGSLRYEELWALQQVSLAVERGEVVGVVGPNGAGKSTLAKVVAGVLRPTRGRRQVRGTIAPLLELGTGFDFELTGYENIFLNALLLGHRNREIKAKVEEIIDFSGLRQFIHTPMRNYSTGMIARLGFAIATAWFPDVLILDEVLTVGDSRFLARCESRIEEFRSAGTTILLISHVSAMIQKYSTRCLWLDRGCMVADGEPGQVLADYEAVMQQGRSEVLPAAGDD